MVGFMRCNAMRCDATASASCIDITLCTSYVTLVCIDMRTLIEITVDGLAQCSCLLCDVHRQLRMSALAFAAPTYRLVYSTPCSHAGLVLHYNDVSHGHTVARITRIELEQILNRMYCTPYSTQ